MGLVNLFVSHPATAAGLTAAGILYVLWTIRGLLTGAPLVWLAERALRRKDYDRAFAIAAFLLRERGFPWANRDDEIWRTILAAAYCVRGTVHGRRGEDGIAVADFDWAIELRPDFEEAYLRQAAAYRKIGHWSRLEDALANCWGVIDALPGRPQPYMSRAVIWALAGDFEEALGDCERALELGPDNPRLLRQVGVLQICAGRFAEAAATLAQAVTLAPANGHGVLMLHLARRGAGADDGTELRSNAAALDRRAWPYPLVALYCGEIEPQDAFAAASRKPQTARERRGETAFYLGALALIGGERETAWPLLHEARDACPAAFLECWAADVALRRAETPLDAVTEPADAAAWS